MKIYALDIETAPKVKTELPYALEPYRLRDDQVMITSVALYCSDGTSSQIHHKMDNFPGRLKAMLESLSGETVYCHNTIFDTGYMLAMVGIEPLRPIKWRDTAILNKYLINGQKADELHISYSLKECVKRAIKSDPELEEFLDVKSQKVSAGEDWDYWLKRGLMDARFTCLLAQTLLKYLLPEMEPGYIMASSAILPLAQGWVEGIPIDKDAVEAYEKKAIARQKEIASEIGVSGSVITSNKQLTDLLFKTWGYDPIGVTPKGAPSVSSENMQRLHQKYADDKRLGLIMEYKKSATMLSKYIKGFKASREYLGRWAVHGSPRILSTITGRMTYSSQLFKKYQVSIALHQIPRGDKGIKRCMVAPKGYKVLYMDISAQEGRIMAIQAPEPRMIKAYNEGIDLHSDLTEEIFGTPYAEIVKANSTGEPRRIVEQRQAGKLTGLSSFYRIGAKSLADKFFATYQYDISVGTAHSYLKSFKAKYPGVVQYWSKAIGSAREKGYAEAIGGFRYRINKFDWKGESAAINHPIQGSGGIQTYTAIGVIARTWPKLILVSQVHDSLAYFVPEEDAIRTGIDIKKKMDKFDYGSLLNFNQTVPLVMDVAIGSNFADLIDITRFEEWKA